MMSRRLTLFADAITLLIFITVIVDSVLDVTSYDAAMKPIEPPTNLKVTQDRSKKTIISWSPPFGDYSSVRLKVIPLTELDRKPFDVIVEKGDKSSYELREVSPGGTYLIEASTQFQGKESVFCASFNYTARPNSPTSLIFWFRNESMLLALWQPPYPAGFYTHYKASIEPPDAHTSVLDINKEGTTPWPARAHFVGLVPGRKYKVTVQTVSGFAMSAPLIGLVRTVPLAPGSITIDSRDIEERSVRVSWLPPEEQSTEFEKYQLTVSLSESEDSEVEGRRLKSIVQARDQPTATTVGGLEPGLHYLVSIKTMSGKSTSLPSTATFTLKPLPVRNLQYHRADTGNAVKVEWEPAEGSSQDEYKVQYFVNSPSDKDGSTLTTSYTNLALENLLPGLNYTILVSALSHGEESKVSRTWVAVR